jgi:hypothetical protein
MFIYQVRPRVFRHEEGTELKFPADTVTRFHLKPLQSFGMEAGGGRTAVYRGKARVTFDANSGQHSIASETPLAPLEVTLKEPGRSVSLQGNILSVEQRFEDHSALATSVEVIFYCFPLLLNVGLADPPYISRVEGTVGGIPFNWELAHWSFEFFTTTQDHQGERISQAWERFDIISVPARRRLVAALHYFHVASRLARCGGTAGEFLPEMVLNLAKTLQVLFPPHGDGQDMDAAREGLERLGYTKEEIEGLFVPAIALRNYVGVGHAHLALLSVDQLRVIHAYAERAETAFRGLLDRILERIEAGEFEVAQYDLKSPRREVLAVIDQLRRYTPTRML